MQGQDAKNNGMDPKAVEMASIMKSGRPPKFTGIVHADVARLPIKVEILDKFVVKSRYADPLVAAAKAINRMLNMKGDLPWLSIL